MSSVLSPLEAALMACLEHGTERLLPPPDVRVTLDEHLDRHEREYLELVLRANEGRLGLAAEAAGINRRTLYRKMRKHGLRQRDFVRG